MTNHEHDDWGDEGGLRPQLDAYAEARLRADPAARARSRARVMAEARAAASTARPIASVRRHRLVLGRFRVPAAIAATLLLVGALTVGAALAGSGPGGPFYAARLWVEEQTLPTDADARAAAQLARLDARLAEATAAAAAGNGAAVTAALEAYRATMEAALGDAGLDPSRREHLASKLGLHVAVLEALVPLVPDRASDAIEAAIGRTERRIQQIIETPPGVTPGKPETPPGKPEAAPATPKPTPPGKPEATPKEPASPKPTPPGKPETPPKEPASPKPTPPGKPETPPGKPEATPAP